MQTVSAKIFLEYLLQQMDFSYKSLQMQIYDGLIQFVIYTCRNLNETVINAFLYDKISKFTRLLFKIRMLANKYDFNGCIQFVIYTCKSLNEKL